MPKGNDILDRLLTHAVAVAKLFSVLPKNRAATHIAGQLLRSGTAAAPNYAEARAGESRQDFVHKLGIALKELNESLVWLEMLRRMEAAPKEIVGPLIGECDELCRIIATSIGTAKKGMREK